MPLVATKTLYVPIESGEKEERRIKINFNQKIGGFYVKLDNIWVFYLTKEEQKEKDIFWDKQLKSFIMLNDNFDPLVKRFEAFLILAAKKISTAKREKILIVTFDVDTCKETHGKDGSYSRETFASSHRYSWYEEEHTQIRFNYVVGYRCGKVLFDEEMKRLGHSYRDESAIIIGWTAKRQEFFSQVQNGFHKLIWEIDEFLKKIQEKPKLLDDRIRNKIKLLPGSGTWRRK